MKIRHFCTLIVSCENFYQTKGGGGVTYSEDTK